LDLGKSEALFLMIVLTPGASACAEILGIDGQYELERLSNQPASTADARPADGKRDGGTGGNGFADASMGPLLPDGAPGDDCSDGCAPVPAECRPGTYTGTFNGSHAPSFTVVGVSLPIKDGIVTLRLGAVPGGLAIESGSLGGSLAVIADFTANLTGTLDCKTKEFGTDATLVGSFTPDIHVNGTFTGEMSGLRLSGTWAEHEVVDSQFGGNGAWSATWTSN
jgi:hypothetical protein